MTATQQLSLANDLVSNVVRLSRQLERLHAAGDERAAAVSKRFASAVRSATVKLKAIEIPAVPQRMTVRHVSKRRDQWAA